MTRIYHGRNLRKGRLSQSNQIYLITVVTFNRNNLFHDYSTGRFVVRELVESERRERAHTLAFVVMPDHLHWLFSLSGENKLSAVIGPMKRHSAKNINRVLNSTGQPVWQLGFHDHALRNEESVIDAARYIIANPLRAGLVKRVGDYPLWDAVWL